MKNTIKTICAILSVGSLLLIGNNATAADNNVSVAVNNGNVAISAANGMLKPMPRGGDQPTAVVIGGPNIHGISGLKPGVMPFPKNGGIDNKNIKEPMIHPIHPIFLNKPIKIDDGGLVYKGDPRNGQLPPGKPGIAPNVPHVKDPMPKIITPPNIHPPMKIDDDGLIYKGNPGNGLLPPGKPGIAPNVPHVKDPMPKVIMPPHIHPPMKIDDDGLIYKGNPGNGLLPPGKPGLVPGVPGVKDPMPKIQPLPPIKPGIADPYHGDPIHILPIKPVPGDQNIVKPIPKGDVQCLAIGCTDLKPGVVVPRQKFDEVKTYIYGDDFKN